MNKCENQQMAYLDDSREENVDDAKKDSAAPICYKSINNVNSEGSAVDQNILDAVSRQEASKTDLNVSRVEHSRTIAGMLVEHVGDVYKKFDCSSAGTCKDSFCEEKESPWCEKKGGEKTGKLPSLLKTTETYSIAGSPLAGIIATAADIHIRWQIHHLL
ncbi:unnamed protein product [Ceratitis capitata]|uniref:(Mediterranean fruit fly) hypothetical protein n=1 Tax=Ceratitis capitata TaxID=7213 RepID=A0A811UT91_CERCA|nr:unnamed protein product [Ceratitis capitata]